MNLPVPPPVDMSGLASMEPQKTLGTASSAGVALPGGVASAAVVAGLSA